MPLASRIEIALQLDVSDGGDKTFTVVSRIAEGAGTIGRPHVTVLHDSHYWADALRELRWAARAAIDGNLDVIRRGSSQCGNDYIYNVISKLHTHGLINKNGGKISLKDLS